MKTAVTLLYVADQPDANGNVITADALPGLLESARKLPNVLRAWIDGARLYAEVSVEGTAVKKPRVRVVAADEYIAELEAKLAEVAAIAEVFYHSESYDQIEGALAAIVKFAPSYDASLGPWLDDCQKERDGTNKTS